MNLEQFAKNAGVAIVDVEHGWGGSLGYREKDYPNTTVVGFRTAQAAYKHWLEGKFGKHTAKAVMKLLDAHNGQS